MRKTVTKSAKETKKLAHKVANELKAGDVLALAGELGTGKTTFVQGIAQFLGISDAVSSPTFTLIQEYQIKNSKLKTQNSKKKSEAKITGYRLLVTRYSLSPRRLLPP